MADDLDSLINTSNTISDQQNDDVDLEDEFARLLNDFIKQDTAASAPSSTSKTEDSGLDSFANNENKEGLDAFTSSAQSKQDEGLDGFVSSSSDNNSTEDDSLDAYTSSAQSTDSLDSLVSSAAPDSHEDLPENMDSEEQELARAMNNFQDAVTAMARNKNLRLPKTDYNEAQLKPNYKPSVGKKIAKYLIECWDMINRYAPEAMKNLSPNATDDDYLNFAETLTDTYLQLAIISYVEILINMEGCEVLYEQKKEIAAKNRIKRELYEEYMELQERKRIFIEKIKEKNFPIDADKLINNYFRAAQKDPDGAFAALTKNPAMFSPIQFEKMHPKFFGLIKVTPVDGIKANQKIGEFIKKLKV